MSWNANELRAAWTELRATEKGAHALELADRLAVSECQLLSTATLPAEPGQPVVATRLFADWKELIARLPALGHVKAVTRNRDAVIETEGSYDNVAFFGPMGQSVGSIDLRIFTSRWAYGFAFTEETRRGTSTGLSFFDATGKAVHKLFLREQSDREAYDAIVATYGRADGAGMIATFEPAEAPPVARPDGEVDVQGLRAAWLALKDTHDFFALLKTFSVTRTQALRRVGDDLAFPVKTTALEDILRACAEAHVTIMVFVGNRGCIQIFSGEVKKVVPMGAWINVLDPGFDLHVRTDRIAEAWVVRKPTVDGIVTALELYDAEGEQLALLCGKRHTGDAENEDWRRLVNALSRLG